MVDWRDNRSVPYQGAKGLLGGTSGGSRGVVVRGKAGPRAPVSQHNAPVLTA